MSANLLTEAWHADVISFDSWTMVHGLEGSTGQEGGFWVKTHEIEVVIPEDHRLTVEVPETIRSGPAKLILIVPVEAPQPGQQTAEHSRSEEIDRLYAELRELMAQSAVGADLDVQIQDRFSRLRKLQEAEADAMEARFRARRRLQPGEGLRALERAKKIIENESSP